MIPVSVGLHQGSSLSPYLFAKIIDVLACGIKDLYPWCMLYADDIVWHQKRDGEKKLEEWRRAMEDRGLTINIKKTVFCIFSGPLHHIPQHVNNNIILFISYVIVQQQDVLSKKTPKVQNMVWPKIQLHGRQIHDYVVSITLVHSMTGHSVATYHNTLGNNASIDVIIRFYIIIVRSSVLASDMLQRYCNVISENCNVFFNLK